MLRGRSLTKEILFMVAVGSILLSSFFLPNAPQILKPLIKWRKNWNKVDRRRIQEAIKRLNKKRLINFIEKGDKVYLEITEEGNKLLKSFDYDELKLPNPKRWDKKWRLVTFDIPDKKKRERNAFSEKLKDLGFYPLQESVFIYPYDCRDEIDFICEFLSISRHVNYCLVESLDKREGDLRNIFNLI
ncbi:MAG: CRISPR-associated endonuclease Cas2 [Candidatus Nealsonbacteria bacterium CG_4_9_14_0_8_um_filter_35_12]|uniref:CRISPR-associated endonuclease Cas2 n=1 Tax=Candidatus Nealsonbacteria bacterium CG_4_9_14_0_8_um_filter_35_12 TaxID=1974692 RepID=A0A2M8DME3_9BACT|nr:MAG: CRISPR-associated endonuclease Cas2 [Candidatus Nealsonbacteria bacterium CG_4_9_14_0_8_um_filter_35_12]